MSYHNFQLISFRVIPAYDFNIPNTGRLMLAAKEAVDMSTAAAPSLIYKECNRIHMCVCKYML